MSEKDNAICFVYLIEKSVYYRVNKGTGHPNKVTHREDDPEQRILALWVCLRTTGDNKHFHLSELHNIILVDF